MPFQVGIGPYDGASVFGPFQPGLLALPGQIENNGVFIFAKCARQVKEVRLHEKTAIQYHLRDVAGGAADLGEEKLSIIDLRPVKRMGKQQSSGNTKGGLEDRGGRYVADGQLRLSTNQIFLRSCALPQCGAGAGRVG